MFRGSDVEISGEQTGGRGMEEVKNGSSTLSDVVGAITGTARREGENQGGNPHPENGLEKTNSTRRLTRR